MKQRSNTFMHACFCVCMFCFGLKLKKAAKNPDRTIQHTGKLTSKLLAYTMFLSFHEMGKICTGIMSKINDIRDSEDVSLGGQIN